jgi:hypothetical protein
MMLTKNSSEDQLERFFKFWALKESYIKVLFSHLTVADSCSACRPLAAGWEWKWNVWSSTTRATVRRTGPTAG